MTLSTLEQQKAELETGVKAVAIKTSGFVVENDDQLQTADQLLIEIRRRTDEIHALLDEPVELAHAAHKSAIKARSTLLEPLEAAEKTIKRVRGAYVLRIEEARKRAIKEADDKRKADEAAAKKKHEEEVAAFNKAQEEKRLESAVKLEAQGKTELAEHVLTAPAPPPPAPPPPPPRSTYVPAYVAPTKTAGVTTRDNWKADIETDPEAARAQLFTLVQAAAANPERFLEFVKINESALHSHAKRTKGTVKVPGVSFWNDVSTSVKAGG